MEPPYVASWPDEVFDTIARAVRLDRLRYTAERTQRRRPTAPESAQIRALVVASIRASLERDEGRGATFSLVLCEKEAADGVQFAEPQDFSEDAIRRLMPLIDPDAEGAGVEWTGGSPRIWGLTARREDALVVRGIAPGRVSVCFGGATIARFNGDECRILSIDQKNMLLGASGLLHEGSDPRAFVKIQFLWALGLVARTFGHGGTFVISGEEAASAIHGGWSFKTPYSGLGALVGPACSEMEALMKQLPDEDPLVLLDEVRGLTFLQTGGLPAGDQGDVLRRIAMWSQVDGAVVMDHSFNILGIGAKLTFDEPVTTWNDWRPTEPRWVAKEGRDGDFIGTRHGSALRFVAAQPRTAALVCSQDGGLTLLGRRLGEERVAIMRHLELVMA